MSSIKFSASLDDSKLQSDIKRANKSIEDWVRGVERSSKGIDQSLSGIGTALATYFSGRELINLGKQVIEVRGQFQQLGIAFETMLDSKEKADKLMNEAITFAAKTPFTLTDVATNIKQLMAMGIETENVMDTMKALGDVAAGVSVPISRVAINYGQVAVLGKLQGRELRDFAMAGIPLVDELAKNLGKSKNEIQDMVTAGQIGFPLVEAAFKSMSGEGGKFYNLMDKQNASVTGQISNLTDKWQVMLNEIGKANEGLIYGGISGLSGLVANYETVVDILKGMVVVLGAVKVATIIVAREQKIQAAISLLTAGATDKATIAEARWVVMSERAAAAQKKLNASLLANPYVLVTAAVAALGYGLYKLITYQTDLEKAINKTQIEIENEKDKALDLFAVLKSTTEGTDKWATARQNIIDQYGDIIPQELQELDTLAKIKLAQDEVNKSLTENIAIRTRQETLQSISEEYNKTIIKAQADIVKKVEKELGKERAALVKYQLAELTAAYKAGLPGAEQELNNFRQKLMAEVGSVNAEGFATSFSAANMAGVFSPLISALKTAQIETDAANKAFAEYTGTIDEQVGADTEIKKAEDEVISAQEEILSLNDEIKLQTELLRNAISNKNEEEIKDIAAKIVLLQTELDLQEKLMEQAIGSAIIRETPISKIPTNISALPTFGTKISNTLVPLRKEAYVATEDSENKINKILQKQYNLRIDIANATADLIYKLGQEVGLSDESMTILTTGLNVITNAISGNLLGVAVSAISGLIELIPTEAERFKDQIVEINGLIEDHQRLVEISQRAGNGDEARAKVIEDLNAKLLAQTEELERKQRNIKIWYTKNREQEIKELTAAIKETENAIVDAEEELSDFIGGGVTQNTIADVIAQGFQEGKTSVDDFAQYMNDALIEAVLNIFKTEILGDSINKATKYISTALSDKILTEEEKNNINNLVKQAADSNQEVWNNLTQALDLGGGSVNAGLSGQISRSITEDTGTELAGLFRRFADEQRVVKDYTKIGVNHLVGIEKNTFDTVAELQKANIKLDTVINNTKQVPAGAL